ncbi:MAG: inositol monophosphatase [Alphaproteobacteria bacterium]|nr:inositol monophosphatase [Alphaproteobacteria bacterium]MBT5389658.1 inositol monophosphatase [Alphaproteobacteria bacterium]
MTRAALKAGRGLIRDFGEVENLQVSRKGPADFVSTADLRSDKILREELSFARPGYSFLTEESGETKGTDEEFRWIIDPLDGTSNFLHSIPHFCISIALEQAGEIIAGVIYDPLRDEMFCAEKGMGAFVNNRRLRVSGRTDLTESMLATGIPFSGHGDREAFVKELQVMMGEIAGVRRLGAAALDLAYVAAGKFEGYWERDLCPWDVAAGILLVQEAGGYVTEIDGGKDVLACKSILAAPPLLYPQLQKLLKSAT